MAPVGRELVAGMAARQATVELQEVAVAQLEAEVAVAQLEAVVWWKVPTPQAAAVRAPPAPYPERKEPLRSKE
jgi:hypothetical protein